MKPFDKNLGAPERLWGPNHVIAFSRSSAGTPEFSPDHNQCTIARTREELSDAFTLLQRRYADVGLSTEVRSPMRVMPYHLWPQTQVFIARQQGQIIGTVSLVRDAREQGVPMESTYRETIEQLRRDGVAFAEVCSLSVASRGGESIGNIFGQLTRLMMFHARFVGIETLVAVVHPRHQKFYQRAMGFQTIGDVKSYHQAAGQPGVPIMGSVNDRSAYRSRWQNFYFHGDFTAEDLAPNRLGPADQTFFRQFVEGRDNGDVASRAA